LSTELTSAPAVAPRSPLPALPIIVSNPEKPGALFDFLLPAKPIGFVVF